MSSLAHGLGFFFYLLSNHLESYLSVRLNLYSKRFADVLYKSVRKITVSAFVNSALVPEYCVKRYKINKWNNETMCMIEKDIWLLRLCHENHD